MAVTINAAVSGQTSDTDSSGTLTEMNAITGVDGQEFFCTTYNHTFRWINNRWFPVHGIDPRYGFMLQDDFLGTVGAPWTAAGTVNATAVGGTGPGQWTITQSTASTRSCIIQNAGGIQLGSMDLYIEAVIRTGALATASEDYCLTVGLNDNSAYNANGAPTDGVYFQYNRAVTGDFWGTRTCSNSSVTANTSTIAVAASTAYRLGIVISAATDAKFFVNGVQTADTHTANLPTGASRQTCLCLKIDKTAGTGASELFVDHLTVYGFFSSARVS